jgi:hypothetical protein
MCRWRFRCGNRKSDQCENKGLIYEDNSYEDEGQDNLKAKVWKISPIKVVAIDSSFLFEVPLKSG